MGRDERLAARLGRLDALAVHLSTRPELDIRSSSAVRTRPESRGRVDGLLAGIGRVGTAV